VLSLPQVTNFSRNYRAMQYFFVEIAKKFAGRNQFE
jgi:hypothetical protein